jgi:RNA polymerase sigma-32 factor
MLTPEQEIELIDAWITTRDQHLLLKLIRAFEPLVMKFVRRYASYGIDKEELIAVGNLALVEVAARFKPELKWKFSTYASHWIKGTMLVFIASNYFSFTMKSNPLKKVFFRLRSMIYREQKKSGVVENTNEIMDKMAAHFGIERSHLDQIYQMIRQPSVSLDEPVRMRADDDALTFGDTVASEDPDPEQLAIDRSTDRYQRKLIQSVMHRVLSERERTILTGQMLMEDDQERTLQDLADEFGLSRERIRQIRNNAYAKVERAIRRRCARVNRQSFL